MLEQSGSCAICYQTSNALVVDHDHNTGEVRGLLCGKCNTLLGMSLDSKTTLTNAVTYLAKMEEV